MNVIFEDIMQRKANIRSVTYVPAGTRIIIFPNEDMWLNDEKRAKEREMIISNKRTTVNAPLISEESTNGTSSGVTYNGNYRENVQPVSASRRAQPRNHNTLIDESTTRQQVPPSTIQQPTNTSSSGNTNDDDVPDLGI